MTIKKNYVLVNSNTLRDTDSVFTGASVYAAAKKAAARGYKKICLRRTGTNTVHEYKGSVKKLKTPKIVTRNGVAIVYKKETNVTKVGTKTR
jgi:hypothetical protein